MNLVNLPPSVQTALTILGVLSFAASVLIRAFGQAEKPWAKPILKVTNDILGLSQKEEKKP